MALCWFCDGDKLRSYRNKLNAAKRRKSELQESKKDYQNNTNFLDCIKGNLSSSLDCSQSLNFGTGYFSYNILTTNLSAAEAMIAENGEKITAIDDEIDYLDLSISSYQSILDDATTGCSRCIVSNK